MAHTLLLNNAGRNADLASLGSKTSAGHAGCLCLPTDCKKGESVQKADPGVASPGSSYCLASWRLQLEIKGKACKQALLFYGGRDLPNRLFPVAQGLEPPLPQAYLIQKN